MNKLYRFSPIKDEATFRKALNYLVTELKKLSEELLNDSLPIKSIKIFAHYPDEYNYLYDLVSKMGPKDPLSSDTSFYVQTDLKIKEVNIKCLGIRIVDPYRMQVGCGDYGIDDVSAFKKQYENRTPFIRDFRGEMIEFWHPDYDVLGYIAPLYKFKNR